MANTTDPALGPAHDVERKAEYYPQDGATNFWMYAVIAAGSAFIIFVAAALYTVCRQTRKECAAASSRRASSMATTRRRSTLYSTTGTNMIDSVRFSVQMEQQAISDPS